MAFKGSLIISGMNAKTIKGDGDEYETAIMYMAPHMLSGRNVCPMAETAKCVEGCLNTAGRAGMFSSIGEARLRKAKRYWDNRAAFMADLVTDVRKFSAYCAKRGIKPAVRLNGTSDIQWEIAHPVVVEGVTYSSIMAAFPMVTFYDYTKIYKRAYRTMPANYRLVLSYSGANEAYAEAVLQAAGDTGMNVTVVYRTKELRNNMMGNLDMLSAGSRNLQHLPYRLEREVIDGDSDDMRFLDPHGVIVGLYAKGKAKQDQSGFVVG